MKALHTILIAGACLVANLSARPLDAQGADKLITRLPGGANAVMVADVGYIRESPDIGRMRWVARGRASAMEALLPGIAGVKHICIGAQLDLNTMRSNWDLGLLEVSALPSLDQIAQGMGGYTDTINGIPAAWSPAGACYLGLDPQTLVSVQPGNRQLISRWVNQVRSGGTALQETSSYLRNASAVVSNDTPIVLALDLRDAFAAPAVIGWLRTRSDDAVFNAVQDRAAAGKVLATIRGVTVKVKVANPTTGMAVVDFDADTAPLAAVFKPLFLEILSERGIAISGLDKWTFTASGRSVTAEGSLSDQALRQLLSILQEPSPEAAEMAASSSGQPSQAAAQQGPANSSMAAASAKYFNTVSATLDSIQPGASLGDQAAFLYRNAQRIDQLPAVNVDPDLLKWGASVSANLRSASSILSAGQDRVTAGSQSAQAPVGAYSTGAWYSNDSDQQNAQYRANLENYRRQNRQAATQIRGQVTQEANKPLQAALDSRGQIRATMVERYGAAFK